MPALTAANLSAERAAAGTRRSSREPLPSWPNPPYPQQATLLSVRTPQLYAPPATRSEEHTSELQSQSNLVCRLLLEKKKEDSAHATHQMAQADECRTRHINMARRTLQTRRRSRSHISTCCPVRGWT